MTRRSVRRKRRDAVGVGVGSASNARVSASDRVRKTRGVPSLRRRGRVVGHDERLRPAIEDRCRPANALSPSAPAGPGFSWKRGHRRGRRVPRRACRCSAVGQRDAPVRVTGSTSTVAGDASCRDRAGLPRDVHRRSGRHSAGSVPTHTSISRPSSGGATSSRSAPVSLGIGRRRRLGIRLRLASAPSSRAAP